MSLIKRDLTEPHHKDCHSLQKNCSNLTTTIYWTDNEINKANTMPLSAVDPGKQL